MWLIVDEGFLPGNCPSLFFLPTNCPLPKLITNKKDPGRFARRQKNDSIHVVHTLISKVR